MFYRSPFPDTVPKEHRIDFKAMILKPFYIMALFAIFFGAASEVVMNQWSSTFMEKALELPKVVGDLLGMCGFAIMLGVGRLLYGIYGSRFNLNNVLIGGSLLGAICYVVVAICPINSISIFACALCGFATSLLWPGTLVLSSEKFPTAGAWMFAILAAAGDIGGAAGPYLTGLIADTSANSSFLTNLALSFSIEPSQIGIRLSLLVAAIFPILTLGCHIILKKMKTKEKREVRLNEIQ